MKKVTTNMPLGQILFIFFILMASSLMFFYFGAKFGGDIMTLAEQQVQQAQEPFLPDDRMAQEIQDILANRDKKFTFHEVVEGKRSLQTLKPSLEKPVAVDKDVPPLQVKADEAAKTPPVETKTAPVKTEANKTVVKAPVADEMAKKVFLPDPSQNTELVKKPAQKAQVAPGKTQSDEGKLKVILPDTPQDLAQAEPAPVPQKTYRLQIGSYAQRSRALQAKSEWEGRGYSVNLVESTIPGKGTWYRLQIGNYGSLSEVQGAQKQIMQNYQQTAMILPVGR